MLGRLHVIVDTIALARAALDGGAPVIQVRIKDVDDRTRYELTKPIVDLCGERGAVCIVNDRLDIALATGAAGVHLGAEDLPVAAARLATSARPSMIVGGTARDAATALRLESEGARYLGVGPVYTSATKMAVPEPLGPVGLKSVCAAVLVPVIAIAGIRFEQVPEVLAAGAYGVAVVGAVATAQDPRRATERLVAALERGP